MLKVQQITKANIFASDSKTKAVVVPFGQSAAGTVGTGQNVDGPFPIQNDSPEA